MKRHRPLERQVKGSSDARLASDPRKLTTIPMKWTKYSGDYLKYIVRPKNGVGRPAASRRIQLARIEVNRALRKLAAFRDVIEYHGRIRPWQA